MNIQHLTDDNLIPILQNETKPIIIDFYSDWCGPCKIITPIIEEIAHERQDICVYKINTQDEPNLASFFDIMSIPTIVIVKNGKIETTIVGVHPKQFILDKIDN